MSKSLLILTGAYYTDGGIAALNRLMLQAVAQAGYSLDILVLAERVDASIDRRYLGGAKATYRAFGGNKIAFTAAVWKASCSDRYEWIFVDHVNLASILSPMGWARRWRYIVWLCGIEVFAPKPDLEGRLGLWGASKGLAISEFTRQNVAARFPKLPIAVCDLALDPVRHTIAADPASGVPITLKAVNGASAVLGDWVILHVGRMTSGERYKGQDSLLHAFPQVYVAHPDAQLVLAGQGDDRPRLENLAKTLPPEMQARIFFPGYVPDDLLDRLYRQSYVFAMPSIGEGFGLVYLEAMSRAKPCLAGRVDASPYVVQGGVTGLLVDDPRSADQVAAALNWFLAHPAETRQMGLAGYERVQSYYLFPHFYERFWKAVRE